jgi:hypothetical protein
MSVGRLRNLQVLNAITQTLIQTTLVSINSEVRIFGGGVVGGRVLRLKVSGLEGVHLFTVSLHRRIF